MWKFVTLKRVHEIDKARFTRLNPWPTTTFDGRDLYAWVAPEIAGNRKLSIREKVTRWVPVPGETRAGFIGDLARFCQCGITTFLLSG